MEVLYVHTAKNYHEASKLSNKTGVKKLIDYICNVTPNYLDHSGERDRILKFLNEFEIPDEWLDCRDRCTKCPFKPAATERSKITDKKNKGGEGS